MPGTGPHRQPRTPSSVADPIGTALAEIGSRLESRIPEVDPDPSDLREFIEVDECDDPQHPRVNTVVRLSDEISLYTDVFEDGLGRALRRQPGIGDVVVEDRDVILLASDRSLEDVHAAVIRAIAQVNRAPLAAESDDDGSVPHEVAFPAVEAAVSVLREAGYLERWHPDESTAYLHRAAADGLVQVVLCTRGSGLGDQGRILDGTMMVMAGVHVLEINHEGRHRAPEALAPAHTTLIHRAWSSPSDFASTVAEHVLPWTEWTASRAEIARRIEATPAVVEIQRSAAWVSVLRDWGYPDAAARLADFNARGWAGLVARLRGRHRVR